MEIKKEKELQELVQEIKNGKRIVRADSGRPSSSALQNKKEKKWDF